MIEQETLITVLIKYNLVIPIRDEDAPNMETADVDARRAVRQRCGRVSLRRRLRTRRASRRVRRCTQIVIRVRPRSSAV